MADITVATAVNSTADQTPSPKGPYWIDVNAGVLVYENNNVDITYARTTDAGANWDINIIETGTVVAISCWFDRETSGDTGTLLHVAWIDHNDQEVKYCNIDIATGTVSSVITIITLAGTDSVRYQNRIALTKTLSGNLITCGCSLNGTYTFSYRSKDTGETWSSIADPWENINNDRVLLYPANTVDPDDAALIYWENSPPDSMYLKMWDNSAGTWTSTTIVSSGIVADGSLWTHDAAVRHSDGAILLAVHIQRDTVTDDVLTFEIIPDSIASPTITAKTNVVTDIPEAVNCAVVVNQQNDDVYVAIISGAGYGSTVDVNFYKSTDDMATWSAATQYNATTDDIRVVSGGRTISDAGGRVQWSWYNDDLTDIFVNLDNDIEIAASGPGPSAFIPKIVWF